jgi:transposase
LADGLAAEGVTPVALASTGVSGKPVLPILEGRFELILGNAPHRKQVPGRKTDAKDAAGIAQRLQQGLLRPRFVPPAPLRELRGRTRQRSPLVADRARSANRIQQGLEGANRKLGRVASAVLGIVSPVRSEGRPDEELGADGYDRQRGERLTRHLVTRLESLGHKVTLEPVRMVG